MDFWALHRSAGYQANRRRASSSVFGTASHCQNRVSVEAQISAWLFAGVFYNTLLHRPVKLTVENVSGSIVNQAGEVGLCLYTAKIEHKSIFNISLLQVMPVQPLKSLGSVPFVIVKLHHCGGIPLHGLKASCNVVRFRKPGGAFFSNSRILIIVGMLLLEVPCVAGLPHPVALVEFCSYFGCSCSAVSVLQNLHSNMRRDTVPEFVGKSGFVRISPVVAVPPVCYPCFGTAAVQS